MFGYFSWINKEGMDKTARTRSKMEKDRAVEKNTGGEKCLANERKQLDDTEGDFYIKV